MKSNCLLFRDNDGCTYTLKELFNYHNLLDDGSDSDVMTSKEFSDLYFMKVGERMELGSGGWIERIN